MRSKDHAAISDLPTVTLFLSVQCHVLGVHQAYLFALPMTEFQTFFVNQIPASQCISKLTTSVKNQLSDDSGYLLYPSPQHCGFVPPKGTCTTGLENLTRGLQKPNF